MTQVDEIYEIADDFGLVKAVDARSVGISNAALVQMARRGKLLRVARGVYRVPIWPSQAAAPYAIAVKAAGEGAYLYGESVVALLALAPTNPSKIWVATPARARRNLGSGIVLIAQQPTARIAWYEGVPCQHAAEAVVCAAETMGPSRALGAVREALKHGYIDAQQAGDISEALAR